MNKIALLLSGGVDSSVALHMLCQTGEKPDCFYIHIGPDEKDSYSCTSEEDIEMASAVAAKYGCKFEIIDLHKEYWDNVVKYTMDKVSRGFTPNPDVMCNTIIKFGAFYDKIGYKYDYIATGHYATRVGYATSKDAPSWAAPEFWIPDNQEWWIAPAKDPIKDQVDFIANIDTKKIPIYKLIFPVGNLMKDEVRKIAEENHLINAKRKDSQGICFLGKINYNDYIEQYLGQEDGKIIELDTGATLGTHHGHWFHTIGQRKGLNLSGGPWYVVGKDPQKNIVYVSHNYDNSKVTEFYVLDPNWLTVDMLDWWFHKAWDGTGDHNFICNVTFKVRHSPERYTGKMYFYGSDKNVKIVSDTPVTAAPGQFCILYDDTYSHCYGCGEMLTQTKIMNRI
jgi:tRNA-specific 2-thiouridylase